MQLGVRKGDRVALLLQNTPQFLVAFFGAVKAGAIVTALDPASSEREIEAQLVDSGAETVVCMIKFYPALKRIQPGTAVTRVISTNLKDYMHPLAAAQFSFAAEKKEGYRVALDPRDYSFRMMLANAGAARPNISLSPEDAALVHYTRGTAPLKGAMLTHRNLVAACLQAASWLVGAAPGKQVTLAAASFFRLYGMQFAMLLSVYHAGALVLLPEFEPGEALLAIDTYRPAFLPGDPAIFTAILESPDADKHDLTTLKTSLAVGAPLAPEVQAAFEKQSRGRMVRGYGLDAVPLTHVRPARGEPRTGSIGVPVPGTEARIVDPQNPEFSLPPGESGELAIRGPQVFNNYWNRPADTAGRLRDGWRMTGETAYMDEDGFFYRKEHAC
jgi:long-chain acyl-CoA synthetase